MPKKKEVAATTETASVEIIANITNVRIFDDTNSVRLSINRPVKGFVIDEFGERIEKELSYIDINRKYLLSTMIQYVDNFDFLIAANGGSNKSIIAALKGAVIKFTRNKFAAGEIYEKDGQELVHQYDGYSSSITGFSVTDAVAEILAENTQNALRI